MSLISGIIGFSLMTNFINDVPIKNNIKEKTQTLCNTCVYVSKTNRVNKLQNPILSINIYKNNTLIKSFNGVSGRYNTQLLDRHSSGNESPSPNGEYILGIPTKGLIKETGGVFLPYEPQFSTNRSNLGVHIDPSWELNNGEDGTSGCLAVKTLTEYNELVKLIQTNNIKSLIINNV
jgi:hypothetical protein